METYLIKHTKIINENSSILQDSPKFHQGKDKREKGETKLWK